jgi:hypothetical protein
METSTVRRRVLEAIDRAKRSAAERRARNDDAARYYETFLQTVAIPLTRQLAGALRASGYPFTVSTPAGGVRLVSDKASQDFIELSLDTSGDQPTVVGHTNRARGRRIIESEEPVGTGSIDQLSETELLDFLIAALGPFLER